MGAWVYIFSKFTPEALLFEALLICVLSAGYAAFWVLRKRRLGVIDNAVPAGVVKSYLNQMILEAEQMRAQLFGMLRSAGVPAGVELASPMMMPQPMAMPAAGRMDADPALIQKISQLEARMAEQARSMQELLGAKTRLEQELAALRASKGAASDADPAASREMTDKITALEGRLAEYSVIEDDLANLKRLQQENTQLRAALAGKGGSVEATIAAAPVAAAVAPVAAPTAELNTDEVEALMSPPEPVADTSIDDLLTAGEDTSALLAADSAVAPAAEPDAFEGLVDQVEESLAPPAEVPAPVVVAAAPAAPAAAAANKAPGNDAKEQSDADLVAEFEKMLNS